MNPSEKKSARRLSLERAQVLAAQLVALPIERKVLPEWRRVAEKLVAALLAGRVVDEPEPPEECPECGALCE